MSVNNYKNESRVIAHMAGTMVALMLLYQVIIILQQDNTFNENLIVPAMVVVFMSGLMWVFLASASLIFYLWKGEFIGVRQFWIGMSLGLLTGVLAIYPYLELMDFLSNEIGGHRIENDPFSG